MISIASIRSTISGSFDISTVIANFGSVTSLRGLEYATGLVELNLNQYSLDGTIQEQSYMSEDARYDRLVVKILTHSASNNSHSHSGVSILSLSGTGILSIEDVLDVDDIDADDYATSPFNLTYLDLSDNAISDVSILLTSPLFLHDSSAILSTLVLDNNLICDPDGVSSVLKDSSFFGSSLNLSIEDQTCMCSMPVSFSNHQVCRQVSSGRWNVECWKGYYYDETTKSCIEASSSTNLSYCESNYRLQAVNDSGTCECRSSWYGTECNDMYSVNIPDKALRNSLCTQIGSSSGCDIPMSLLANISGSFSIPSSTIDLTGVEYLIGISEIVLNSPNLTNTTPLSKLSQLVNIVGYATDNFVYALDHLDLFSVGRLTGSTIFGGYLNDITPFYRSISMHHFETSWVDGSHNYRSPICRSEQDNVFWDFLSDVFPLLGNVTSGYSLSWDIMPNNCPFSLSLTPYVCAGAYCPSLILNQIYNISTESIECAAIAYQDGSICHTIHDPYLRTILVNSSSDITLNSSIVTVDTLRQSSLATLSIGTSDWSNVTKLQGLEYLG
ncbi:hypothetical protein ADUPG1_000191, partial [Aduncisulcus paluster]